MLFAPTYREQPSRQEETDAALPGNVMSSHVAPLAPAEKTVLVGHLPVKQEKTREVYLAEFPQNLL